MNQITPDKLNVYNKYNGDIDAFAKAGLDKEKSQLTSTDWLTIEDFIQRIRLIENGMTSDDFKATTLRELKKVSDSKVYQSLISKLI